jgi:hypothetical protein
MPCYNASGAVIAPKVYLGRSVPPVQGSWTNTIRYGNFRLYGMVDYTTGFKRLDNNLRIRCQIFYTCLEYLQPDKTDPRVLVQMQSNGTLRDFVINDSKYAKLREISLSYDVPENLASRVRAKGLSATISGRNLHTWTPYTGLDPESQFVSGTPIFTDQADQPEIEVDVIYLLRI